MDYLAALVVKALVKHGWPAVSRKAPGVDGFTVLHHELGDKYPPDFLNAVGIAARIAARTHRIDITEIEGTIMFNRSYRVTPGGFFRENSK